MMLSSRCGWLHVDCVEVMVPYGLGDVWKTKSKYMDVVGEHQITATKKCLAREPGSH